MYMIIIYTYLYLMMAMLSLQGKLNHIMIYSYLISYTFDSYILNNIGYAHDVHPVNTYFIVNTLLIYIIT